MEQSKGRAEWMSGRWGLMVHWLAPGPPPERGEPRTDLNDAVDHFDVRRFLQDVDATGAHWVIFTIGQNTGYYASPNTLLDRWVGPGHCSRRDLVGEIAAGVHRLGKRFIAYLPCEVAGNDSVQDAFLWNRTEGTDQKPFQERYTQFVREWAIRWGKTLDGWWFDGCYPWPIFHNKHMDWPVWYHASRAANPDAVVTFNDGSFCVGILDPIVPDHDYLSGEVEVLIDGKIHLGRDGQKLYLPSRKMVEGTACLWHALVPIDAAWGHGCPPGGVFARRFKPVQELKQGQMESPVYPDAELGGFLKHCLGVGGAVTFNVGIFQEGGLGRETLQQLKRIGR